MGRGVLAVSCFGCVYTLYVLQCMLQIDGPPHATDGKCGDKIMTIMCLKQPFETLSARFHLEIEMNFSYF
jgi:hypothetical protein